MPTAILRKSGSAINAECDDGQAFRVKATLKEIGSLLVDLRSAGYQIKADRASAALARRWRERQGKDQPPIRKTDAWKHQAEAFNFAYGRKARR